MRRALFLSVIAYSLVFSGLLLLNGSILALGLPFAIYLFLSFVFTPKDLNITVNRTLSANRVTPGQSVTIKVSITNQGNALQNVLIEDRLSPRLSVQDGSPRHILNLAKGETQSWSYTLTGSRGMFSFHQIFVEVQDFLGLKTVQQTFPTEGQLLILPSLMKIKRVAIRPRKTRVYSGEIPARSGGLGVDFFGVREYQHGDSPRWINWRASARYASKLYSNEYEQERVSDVGIILDGRERSNFISANQSIFEYSVLAAANLANAFLAQGDRVSLLHYGKYLKWTFPGYGKLQREKILRELSQAEPGSSLVFSYLQFIPIQIFPPKSQIVVISPLMPDDLEVLLQLRAHGYRVLVVSPDSISFEQSHLPHSQEVDQAARILHIERKLFLRKLLQAGIRVVNWEVSQPFDKVVYGLRRSPLISRSAGIVQ